MLGYRICAIVTVEVDMVVKAASVAEAQSMFEGNIMMSASLADIPSDRFIVEEDSISELEVSAVTEVSGEFVLKK